MDAAPRIFVCGQLALEHGPALVREADFPGRQTRRFWAYLVLNRRRPCARGELAEAIWGDDTPDAWDSTLSAVASRLRSALQPISSDTGLCVQSKGGCYVLQAPTQTFVDYERARAAIHASDVAIRDKNLSFALTEARVAMEIAARGFLRGEEGPWIQRERSLLADIQVRAMERTIEAEIELHNADLAEQEARLLVGLDPLRESGYRLLMRALVAGGNRAEVARVLADCRAVLREQVGMGPSQETERLFHELTRT